MLKLLDIRKSYRLGPVEVPVLKGICLEVAKGDLLSVMGPSGSGKSTLMNIVGLLARPTSGTYLLNGRDVLTMDDRELSEFRNAQIGFVFQSFNLLPQLTALENVSLPLVYRGMDRGEAKRRARETLERVGIPDRTGHRPDQLSGGQKQRVAIARALVGEPAVVLADEPTGALDAATAADIMALLSRLNLQDDLTIVIITHDPGIADQCLRRTRIAEGMLYDDGPVTDVGPARP